MRNIFIKSKSIRENVYDTLVKEYDEKLSNEEALEIKRLYINSKDGLDIENDIFFSDLELLPNIESLTLARFRLNKEIIEEVEKCNNLKELVIKGCIIPKNLNINLKIERLVVSHTKINDFVNFKNCEDITEIKVIEDEKVDLNAFKQFKKLKKLEIYNSNIINADNIMELKALQEIWLDGSVVDTPNFKKDLFPKIDFYYKPEYHE